MRIIYKNISPKRPEYLVTGAAGFLGSQLVWRLLDDGKSVRATDLRAPWWLKDRTYEMSSGRLEFMMADLTDSFSLLPVLRGIRYAFHLAALFDHGAKEEALQKINVRGTENFFSTARVSGIERIVHMGSMSVYGHDYNAEPGCAFALYETKKPNPADPYARSKQKSREIAASYNGVNNLEVFIIDPAGVFGPHSIYGNVGIIKALLNGLMLLPEGGKHSASMVHSEDVVRLCHHLMHIPFHHSGNDPQELSYLAADITPVTAEKLMNKIWDEIPAEKQKKLLKEITSKIPIRKAMVLPLAHGVQFAARVYNATVVPVFNEFFGRINPLKPDLNPYAIKYGFGNHSACPNKALNTSFTLQYPRTDDTIKDVMGWHREKGLLKE